MMGYLGLAEILAPFRCLMDWKNNEFEEELARWVGCRYALGTNYGRTALYLSLRAIGVEGKEVMVPGFTCSVVRDAIILAGGIPVYVDVNPAQLNLVLEDAERKVSRKTVAIIFIHYFGSVASNMEDIQKFAKNKNIKIIEDCAHSLGAKYKGIRVGNFGDVGIFSFTKNTLNCAGGMIVSNDVNLYKKAKNILVSEERTNKLGKAKKYYYVMSYGYQTTIDKILYDRVGKSIFKWWLIRIPDIFPGSIIKIFKKLKGKVGIKRNNSFYEIGKENIGRVEKIVNLSMCQITGRIGRIQLKKVDRLNEKRIEIANKIGQLLPEFTMKEWNSINDIKNVYSHFPFWFDGYDIDKIVEGCKKEGLLLRRNWAASSNWWPEQETKNVEVIKRNLLLGNINPMLTDKEIERMGQIIKKVSESQI